MGPFTPSIIVPGREASRHTDTEGRRTRVIGIFPSIASALRLIGMILLEQTEDLHASKRYMSEDSMAQLYAKDAAG
jgi:hypothetical protein